MSAYDVFTRLKQEHGIYVCPNGGDLKSKIFRVGHIGNLSIKDYDVLIDRLNKVVKES
jgi:aspartate aminotransferase-like enzyme